MNRSRPHRRAAAALALAAIALSAHPRLSPAAAYEPTWESLERRPTPAWFDDEKIGIFIHWSVFSVPAVAWVYPDQPYGHGGHSCWYGLYVDRVRPLRAPDQQAKFEEYHRRIYGDVPFKDLAPLFKAEAFDARKWAALFKRAGARYAFLTSNFHDGFCLWPSPYSPGWNSADTGPRRDLLGEFSEGMREAGVRPGFYYSIAEFNHPLYRAAREPGGDIGPFVRDHFQPQLREAVRRYRPAFLYLDGEWDYPLDTFGMRDFLAWLYTDAPCADEVVVNDRFGKGSRGKYGGVYSSEAGVMESGIDHKWCEDRPISRGNWSYNRLETLEDYLSERDMIHLLVETVARGGNLHLDVSPHADGTIPMLQQERLIQLGDWLAINGEAIYGTRRWNTHSEGPMVESLNPHLENDKGWRWTLATERALVHYTCKGDALHAICLAWPGPRLRLDHATRRPPTEVRMIGLEQPLAWKMEGDALAIDLPARPPERCPCRNAYVITITGAKIDP